MKYVAIVALTAVFFANAFDYPVAPSQSYFGGSQWRSRDLLVVPPEGIELQRDTVIKLDELVLKGPLYSNGYSLKIDVLQLRFEGEGAIRGFKSPAPAGAARVTGATGERSVRERGTGGNGHTPEPAEPGVDGKSNPGAIVIFASSFVGKVVVDGVGQAGGVGGKGGAGGKGGTGGPGRNARANCYHWIGGSEVTSTIGGRGGQGAPGGRGGNGGRGGAPIPIILASGIKLSVDAKVISKVGDRGAAGAAGAPGAPGDGGPGGIGSVVKCGSWPVTWRRSVGGSGRGPSGPAQTETLGMGSIGALGPTVNLETEPLPKFSLLAQKDHPGVIRTNLQPLEVKRNELVDAWMEFHWARTFLFLILDTFSELSQQQFNSQGDINTLLNQIVTLADNDRLKELSQLWSVRFIVPLRSQKTDEFNGPIQVAEDVVRFLNLLIEDKQPSDQLRLLLERVRSGAYSKVQGALNNAVESCRSYITVKDGQLKQVLQLTSQYAVPVCEGNPNFLESENIDKAINFFYPGAAFFDEELTKYYQRLSWLSILKKAHAEGFVAVPVENPDAKPIDIQSRIPDRGVWLAKGFGVFSGFPAIARHKTVSDIGREIYYLEQNFVRMKNRTSK